MASRIQLTTALGLVLLLQGCATEDARTAADPIEDPPATASVDQEPGGPRFPLPQPAGERAVGARIWEYRIELTRDTVQAGEVEFHVVNAGTDEHWLIVRNAEFFDGTPHLFPGDSAVLHVVLEPGDYTIVCTIRDEFDHISEGERVSFVVL
ncbi:MAG: hypothetical protein WD766_13370 [Gemmatimonadota bacterium]